ncbi:unnamed protein product [Urochloa humidicola]
MRTRTRDAQDVDEIKNDQGQNDMQLSKGFLTLEGATRGSWDKMKWRLLFQLKLRRESFMATSPLAPAPS